MALHQLGKNHGPGQRATGTHLLKHEMLKLETKADLDGLISEGITV
jgi:hypothetical protein